MKQSLCTMGLTTALWVLGAASMAPAAQAASAEPTLARHDADAAYERQDFAQALVAYERLAAQGDARAAALAGQMLWFGHTMYGPSLPRDAARAQRWLAQAAADGCEVSAYLLQHMSRFSPSAPAQTPYVPGEQGC